MKFVVAVVMLALAFGTESSVIPWAAPLSYTAVSGPGVVAVAPGHLGSVAIQAKTIAASPAAVVAAHAPVAPLVAAHAWGPAPAAVAVAAAPAVVAHAAPAIVAGPAVVAAPAIVAEGSYVAKTRGAVHVAPLAGHANSAASINLQPAPGTI